MWFSSELGLLDIVKANVCQRCWFDVFSGSVVDISSMLFFSVFHTFFYLRYKTRKVRIYAVRWRNLEVCGWVLPFRIKDLGISVCVFKTECILSLKAILSVRTHIRQQIQCNIQAMDIFISILARFHYGNFSVYTCGYVYITTYSTVVFMSSSVLVTPAVCWGMQMLRDTGE